MENTTNNTMNLEYIKTQLLESMNDYAKDFFDQYISSCGAYISDSMNEYADQNTSIYYYDQRKFYNEHAELCEDALCEYGYTEETLCEALKNHGGTLDGLICFAGAIGEYKFIYDSIAENEKEIKELYAIHQMQELGIEELNETTLSILEDSHDCNEWEEITDLVNEAFTHDEE